MSMEYIRKHYGVPAKRGGKVRFAPVLFEGVGPACLNGECPEGKLSCGKPWK